jgi:hypothetical protein
MISGFSPTSASRAERTSSKVLSPETPRLVGTARAHPARLADVSGAHEPDAGQCDVGLPGDALDDACEHRIGRAFARDGEGYRL